MKLITKEIAKRLPKLGDTDSAGGGAVAQVKFFTPDSSWTWFITEWDGKDTLYGLAIGFEAELGCVSLHELETATGPLRLHIERDASFQPRPLRECEGCPQWLIDCTGD